MPYMMGRQLGLWLFVTTFLAVGAWLVWHFESGGLGSGGVRPTYGEQAIVEQKARALIEQARQNPEAFKETALEAAETLRQKADFVLHDATFFGQNNEGTGWRIQAAEAAQPEGERLIYLRGLQATTHKEGAEDVSIQSRSGLLDDEADILFLKEGFKGVVHKHETSGKEATYYLKKQIAEGRGLDVSGMDVSLAATVFNANLHEETARFSEGVRLRVSFNKTASGLALGGGR